MRYRDPFMDLLGREGSDTDVSQYLRSRQDLRMPFLYRDEGMRVMFELRLPPEKLPRSDLPHKERSDVLSSFNSVNSPATMIKVGASVTGAS